MKKNQTTLAKPAPAITAIELLRHLGAGESISLVDVRETEPFHARHIGGSVNAPDSQTTALVRKVQAMKRAVLVCEDGRLSAMVARTLGFCGFRDLAILEGGLQAWVAAGGALCETTRSGFEHELPPPESVDPAPPKLSLLGRLQRLLTI